MQLFFSQEINSATKEFTFDKNESRHIIRVLRKSDGDLVHITNGNGDLFEGQIIVPNDKRCTVQIVKCTSFKKPWNYYLHIAIAPTKNNDRLEWFLEKATEIGVHEITPIICEHSERKVYKIDRAEKIIQAAMKQSLQYFLPKINEPISFSEFIKKHNADSKFIAHCEETERKSLKNTAKAKDNIIILIGPEGDFSSKEINLALENKYIPITLGNTRLRTETAALAACHTIALLNE